MLEATLAMLMMLPPPAASMPGSTAWISHELGAHVEREGGVEIGVVGFERRCRCARRPCS